MGAHQMTRDVTRGCPGHSPPRARRRRADRRMITTAPKRRGRNIERKAFAG